MRLFVGIPLTDLVRAELAAVVDRLRRGSGDLRWAAPETWHVTLQFLGNAGAEQLDCLKARLGEVRSELVPLRLGALGAFEHAGIVHLEVELTPELTALQKRVAEATAKCGFVADERAFHPHITLARAKGRERFRGMPHSWRVNLPVFTAFEGREFLLYESFTEPAGSRHEVRARFSLGM